MKQFLSFQADLPPPLSLPLSLHQRRKTDGGEIDWKWGLAVSCVCVRARPREEQIKGGRTLKESERERERPIAEWDKEGRQGQFASVIYFLPDNLKVQTRSPGLRSFVSQKVKR